MNEHVMRMCGQYDDGADDDYDKANNADNAEEAVGVVAAMLIRRG